MRYPRDSKLSLLDCSSARTSRATVRPWVSHELVGFGPVDLMLLLALAGGVFAMVPAISDLLAFGSLAFLGVFGLVNHAFARTATRRRAAAGDVGDGSVELFVASVEIGVVAGVAGRRGRGLSDRDDLDEGAEWLEVAGVAGVEREARGDGGGGDEQVDRSCTARFASCVDDRGEDAAIGAGCVRVERERVECGFGPLESVLTAAALGRVVGGVWACCELSESDCADGNLDGQ